MLAGVKKLYSVFIIAFSHSDWNKKMNVTLPYFYEVFLEAAAYRWGFSNSTAGAIAALVRLCYK